MGFDPMNEPPIGSDNFLQFIDQTTRGWFDKSVLTPFYTRIYKEALKITNKKSIMHFEPVSLDLAEVMDFKLKG
jgi:hypothetical protein